MNYQTVRIGSGVLLLGALVLVVTTPAHGQDAATLFKTKCAACHDADGSGSGSMGKQLGVTDLRADAVQKQTDAQLNDSITNGKARKCRPTRASLRTIKSRGWWDTFAS